MCWPTVLLTFGAAVFYKFALAAFFYRVGLRALRAEIQSGLEDADQKFHPLHDRSARPLCAELHLQ